MSMYDPLFFLREKRTSSLWATILLPPVPFFFLWCSMTTGSRRRGAHGMRLYSRPAVAWCLQPEPLAMHRQVQPSLTVAGPTAHAGTHGWSGVARGRAGTHSQREQRVHTAGHGQLELATRAGSRSSPGCIGSSQRLGMRVSTKELATGRITKEEKRK